MKRISLLLLGLLGSAGASTVRAQETLFSGGLAITAAHQTNLSNIITANNARTCLRVTAVGGESCTQAQACTAIGNPSGCSSTPATARGLNVRIYPNTTAGHDEWATFVYLVPRFIADLSDPAGFEQERMCINWQAFNTTQRNTLCTAAGRPTGCRLCQ